MSFFALFPSSFVFFLSFLFFFLAHFAVSAVIGFRVHFSLSFFVAFFLCLLNTKYFVFFLQKKNMLTENEGRSKKPSISIGFLLEFFICMCVCVSCSFDFFLNFNLSTRSLLVKIGNDKQIMDHDVIRLR